MTYINAFTSYMDESPEFSPAAVGKRILGIRLSHGLSQSQLAQKCGFSVTALSGWENGRQRPSIALASRICDVFNVTTDYLLRGKTEYLAHTVFMQLHGDEPKT